MKQATLDLLDASLRRDFDAYIAASPRHRQKFFSHSFQADPVQWVQYSAYFANTPLHWDEFRYKDAVEANDLDVRIPTDEPGLYIFFAQPDTLVGGFPQFPFYGGISNDRNSNRPLRERLKDYFRLETVAKRDNVDQMLQLYYPHVWIKFTLLNWTTQRLKELETNLHEYLGFPFAKQAYTPTSKKARGAWGR
jgi:hypothetical protein